MKGILTNKDGRFVAYYWNKSLKKSIYIGTYDTIEEAEYERNFYIAKVYDGEIDETLPKTHGLPKGVYKTTHGSKYASNITMRSLKGDRILTRYIGAYETPEEAAEARTEFIMGLI